MLDKVIKGQHNACPVPGCMGGGREKFSIYRHFIYRHLDNEIVISEDGILTKCNRCGMRVSNLLTQQQSPTCAKGWRRRENEVKQAAQARADNVCFMVNGKQIERVNQFRYLGRIFDAHDDDRMCIQDNLRKARQRWNAIAKILKVEGSNAKTMATFYLTIVQAVLLYGADSWVVTKRDMDKL